MNFRFVIYRETADKRLKLALKPEISGFELAMAIREMLHDAEGSSLVSLSDAAKSELLSQLTIKVEPAPPEEPKPTWEPV
jgi:hypothetical protein